MTNDDADLAAFTSEVSDAITTASIRHGVQHKDGCWQLDGSLDCHCGLTDALLAATRPSR